jgi:hypothetical protein
MNLYIVMVRKKDRLEFPEYWLLKATPDEAKDLEERIRELFDDGIIKDFFFQPIKGTEGYHDVHDALDVIQYYGG